MAIIKCKMCGGDLNIIEGLSVAECEYCGSKQTIPTADNEKKMTLFTRASRLLRGCEFDKAAGVFENIVAEFPDEAEAYWGLVLCKYGIEYVDDPATGKKVPTCHRSSFESVLDDVNFELACENTDAVARRLYRTEARQIEELRRAIIEVSGREDPYDLFISYKETDEHGERTLDSVIAQDIYDAFTQEAYRVFFSRISLEDKLGVEYEPYIFAALNSANVMLVVGTDYENFDSVWVKNEWSRFLKLMSQDKNKHLIPVYKNMDPYDMPKEFVKLAAQDMGKLGAMQDLVRGVKKLAGEKKAPVEEKRETVVIQQSGGANVTAIVKRGYMALEDKNWNDAAGYFDRVLDMDAECAEAYLGLFLIENNSVSPKAFVALILKQNEDCEVIVLEACPEDTERMQRIVEENYVLPHYQKKENIEKLFPFDRTYESSTEARNSQLVSVKAWLEQNKNLVRAFRFADGEALDMLNDMQNGVNYGLQNRVDKARAQDEANVARIKDAYEEHLDKVEAEAKRQREEAEAQCEADYLAACEYADRVNTEHLLLDAAQRFNAPKLRNYKDSAKRAEACKQRAEKIKAERIAAQEAERKRILAEKEAERQRVLAEKEAERQRKAAEKEERKRLAAEESERKRALARERRIEAAAKAKKIVIALCIVGVLAAAGIFLIPKAIEIAPSVIQKVQQGKETEAVEPTVQEQAETAVIDTEKPTPTEEPVGDISWELSDDGTLTISGTGAMENYKATSYTAPWLEPSRKFSIKKIVISPGVTSVGDFAFTECRNVEEIVLPKGLKSLGIAVFQGCDISSITIPEGVENIPPSAFSMCQFLREVTLPSTLKSIGSRAFQGTPLESIAIPEGVTSIGSYAFHGCDSLVDITIPDTVVKLGSSTFSSCLSLREITVPYGVESLPEYVFSGCRDLSNVQLPSTLQKIDDNAFSNTYNLSSLVIPEGVKSIGVGAFQQSGIRNITLPASLEIVFSKAFENSKLSSVEYTGKKEQWDNLDIHSCNEPLLTADVHCTALASGKDGSNINWILSDNGTLTISGTGILGGGGWTSDEYKNSIKKVIISPNITGISNFAFTGCKNLQEVVLQDGLETIYKEAFSNCVSLRKITLPASLKVVDSDAFLNCPSSIDVEYMGSESQWKEVYISKIGHTDGNISLLNGNINCVAIASGEAGENISWNLTKDGTLTISGSGRMEDYTVRVDSKYPAPWFAVGIRENIRKLVINPGITYIGENAFAMCPELREAQLPEGLLEIGDSAFSRSENLRTVVLPSTLTSIGEQAFNWCFDLVDVNLPSSLQSMGRAAFNDCNSLGSIIIPEGIERIPDSAFSNCDMLSEVVLPSTLKGIGMGAFESTRSLGEINIPEGVITLDPFSFSKSSISSIRLPASLEFVAGNAFRDCGSLRSVEYMGTQEQWSKVEIVAGKGNDPLLNANIEFAAIAAGEAGENISWVLDNEGKLSFTGKGEMNSENTAWKEYADEIKSCVISEGISSICENAFSGCSSLKSINLPSSIESIGATAFAYTNSLDSMVVPEGITVIHGGTFLYSGINRITLPSSLEQINSKAFSVCTNLRNIEFAGTEEQWKNVYI